MAPLHAIGTDGFWRGVVDSVRAQVAVLDGTGTILAVNEEWRGVAAEAGVEDTFVGTSYLDVCSQAEPDPGARTAADGVRSVMTGTAEVFSLVYPCPTPSGDRWFKMLVTPYVGNPGCVVVVHYDVTAQRAAELEVAAQAALLDELHVAVVATACDGRITHWNRGAEVLYGWSRAEAVGMPADQRSGGALTIEAGVGCCGESTDSHLSLQRKDGTAFPGHVRRSPMLDEHGRAIGTIAVSMDESSQVKARQYLHAVTDSMGEGLLALDAEGLVTLMNRAAESMLGWPLADIRGLPLHEVVHYRHEDGTPFPVGECPIVRSRRSAVTARVAEDMFITRDGRELPVSYTSSPLRDPDGREGCVVVFMDATHIRAEQERLRLRVARLSSVNRVEEALREERFELFAQPIVDLGTGQVVQHELLLRVREADGSVVGPVSYLLAAEEHGLIGAIDRRVIKEALALAERGYPVELNVSASSVSDPHLLLDVERWLRDFEADPSLLVFEITETAVITDADAGRSFVRRLHELGCKVALDDFGTGYGGFTYLKHLPLDYLKIDIEFVADLVTNQASRHVVEAVVNLAAGFGLETVAEGVEDAETLELLTGLGVGFGQGFHLGRPGPLADTLFRHPSTHGKHTSRREELMRHD